MKVTKTDNGRKIDLVTNDRKPKISLFIKNSVDRQGKELRPDGARNNQGVQWNANVKAPQIL